MLTLPGDIPRVTPAEIDAVVSSRRAGAVLHHRAGARRAGLQRRAVRAARGGAAAVRRQQLLPASGGRASRRHRADHRAAARHRAGHRPSRRICARSCARRACRRAPWRCWKSSAFDDGLFGDSSGATSNSQRSERQPAHFGNCRVVRVMATRGASALACPITPNMLWTKETSAMFYWEILRWAARSIFICWLLWIFVWVIAALRTKPVLHQESTGSRAFYLLPIVASMILLLLAKRTQIGSALFAAGPPLSWLFARFIPFYSGVVWIGAPLMLAGTLLAFWARFHLAGNWSSGVVLKQDHELIRSGPYRFVRHPIYTGALLAVAGTACAIGQWRGVLGFMLHVVRSLVQEPTRGTADGRHVRRRVPPLSVAGEKADPVCPMIPAHPQA